MGSTMENRDLERIVELLAAPWPEAMEQVDDWLAGLRFGRMTLRGAGRHRAETAAGVVSGDAISEIDLTPVQIDLYQGRPYVMSWFSPWGTVIPFRENSEFIANLSELIGIPSEQNGAGAFWTSGEFLVESYAYGKRSLSPSHQVCVSLPAISHWINSAARAAQ